MTKPTIADVTAMTRVAGIAVTLEEATRIAQSIGPAFEGFAAIAGTLAFDLEPATFILVQSGATAR